MCLTATLPLAWEAPFRSRPPAASADACSSAPALLLCLTSVEATCIASSCERSPAPTPMARCAWSSPWPAPMASSSKSDEASR